MESYIITTIRSGMYLEQFHLNIKYKKGNTNNVVDCLNKPLVLVLTTILNSRGNETFGWAQLYDNDPDFATMCQSLGAGKLVMNFHL